MKRLAFIHANLVTPDRIWRDASVVVEDGKIAAIGPGAEGEAFEGQVIDAKGQYLSPGFIDIHSHGGGGCDFMDGTEEAFITACTTHAQYGTTAILPTTLAGADEELRHTFQVFANARKRIYPGAKMLGLHLEGPYFSWEYRGAQDERYLKNPTPEDYTRIYEWSQGSIVRWSAAPELPGAEEFGRFLRENGILGSIAHTAATYDDVLKAYENGFYMITHLYSGMSTIVREKGFRIPGVVESAYLIDGLKAELIADGCHLPPALLRLAYKGKGTENLVLVTDSMRGAGMEEGPSILGSLKNGQPAIIRDGVAYLPDFSAFAGSVCTADRLVRTMYKEVGIPLCEVIQMMTRNPARAIGVDAHKGCLAVGMDADIVLFDEDIRVHLTMVEGTIVYSRGECEYVGIV